VIGILTVVYPYPELKLSEIISPKDNLKLQSTQGLKVGEGEWGPKTSTEFYYVKVKV